MFRLFRFLYAATNAVAEVPFRNALVRLTVVGTDACPAADQLIDQAIVCRVSRNFLRESHDPLAKGRCAFFQVKRMLQSSVFGRRVIQQQHPIGARRILDSYPSALRPIWSLGIGASLELGGWLLDVLWSLDVGPWCFFRASRAKGRPIVSRNRRRSIRCPRARSSWRWQRRPRRLCPSPFARSASARVRRG